MLCSLRKKLTEPINGAFPKRLMPRYPSARLLERLPAQTKTMDTAFHLAFNYSGLLQYLQMFGYSGLCRAELAPEFASTSGLAAR
jgi:hypothetical protein